MMLILPPPVSQGNLILPIGGEPHPNRMAMIPDLTDASACLRQQAGGLIFLT
jgi:hypothetical protein